jgi:hypothetical protein
MAEMEVRSAHHVPKAFIGRSRRRMYTAFGLTICSDIELPGFPASIEEFDPDVEIRVALQRREYSAKSRPSSIVATPDEVVFHWDWVGTYTVRHGREILIEPLRGVEEALLRLPLDGAVFGALLHQRSFGVINASAVRMGDAAVAFVGLRGAGKSTMAAALVARGHTLVADDTVAIDRTDDGRFVMRPGVPRVTLWPDSAASAGFRPEWLPALHASGDKRALDAAEGFSSEALPIRAIYLLANGEAASVDRIASRQALFELFPHTWAMRYMGNHVCTPAHLMATFGPLVRQVPIRRLARPIALDRLNDAVAAVERDVSLLGRSGNVLA